MAMQTTCNTERAATQRTFTSCHMHSDHHAQPSQRHLGCCQHGNVAAGQMPLGAPCMGSMTRSEPARLLSNGEQMQIAMRMAADRRSSSVRIEARVATRLRKM